MPKPRGRNAQTLESVCNYINRNVRPNCPPIIRVETLEEALEFANLYVMYDRAERDEDEENDYEPTKDEVEYAVDCVLGIERRIVDEDQSTPARKGPKAQG